MLDAVRVYIPPLVYLELAKPPVIYWLEFILYSPSKMDPANEVGTEERTTMSDVSSVPSVTDFED